MFLNSDELADMTGYKRAREQATWLARNGYSFDIRADGRPNVLLEQVRERQLKGADSGERPRVDLSGIA